MLFLNRSNRQPYSNILIPLLTALLIVPFACATFVEPPLFTAEMSLDSNGNLVIECSDNADTLFLSISGANIRIHDPNNFFSAGPGAIKVDDHTLECPLAEISGEIIVNTNGGDDNLTVDYDGGNFSIPIIYNGGSQDSSYPGDVLTLNGGAAFAQAEFYFINSHDGSIELSGNAPLTYRGLEPISSSITATNVTLNYSNAEETIDFFDPGGGQTGVSSTLGEFTAFNNPSNMLTINAGNTGVNIINVNYLPPAYPAIVQINGGDGGDTVNVNGALSFAAGSNVIINAQDVIVSSPVDMGGNTLMLNVTGSGSSVDDVISNGSFVKDGSGSLTVTSFNTYAGTTTVSGGTLLVNGSTAIGSAVTLATGATLGGTGDVGTINANSGSTIAAGESPGILASRDVTFDAGSTFDVEIGGTLPGSMSDNHDRLKVIGTVDLGGASLMLGSFGGFSPSASDTFTIIDNDGADAVVGIFSGLAEGATINNFLGSGQDTMITYTGGDGNDVVIQQIVPQVQSVPTLSEWGMIILVLGLAFAAYRKVRQQSSVYA